MTGSGWGHVACRWLALHSRPPRSSSWTHSPDSLCPSTCQVTQFERIVVCAYEIFGLGVVSICFFILNMHSRDACLKGAVSLSWWSQELLGSKAMV